MTQTTGIYFHPKFATGHDVLNMPERPDRAKVIHDRIISSSQLNGKLEEVEPSRANLEHLYFTHSREYVAALLSSCAQGRHHIDYSSMPTGSDAWYLRTVWRDSNAIYDPKNTSPESDDVLLPLDVALFESPDERIRNAKFLLRRYEHGNTPIAADTYDTALLACGAAIQAVQDVLSGRFKNAFCIVRPPGHHAEYDTAMGFCFFNNIAVAANYLLQVEKLSRIMIVDFDVHHGNGAEHTFYDDARVVVCNFHRKDEHNPFYPAYYGLESEDGFGDAKGTNFNFTLPAGSDGSAYQESISQLIRIADVHKPEFILISAGFDAHISDCLGGMRLSDGFFGACITDVLMKIAKKHCDGRLVSLLEGGYGRRIDSNSYDRSGIANSAHSHVLRLTE